MERHFLVLVDWKSTRVVEKFEAQKRVDWACRTDGVKINYAIECDCVGKPPRWFERGTVELQYHVKNISQSGIVYWDKRNKRPYTMTKKAKAIMAKMEKLL